MEVMEDILLPPMQATEFEDGPEPEPDRKVIMGVCVMDKKVGTNVVLASVKAACWALLTLCTAVHCVH